MKKRRRKKSTRLKRVREYHERTKHRLDRFAISAGSMDWENQPDPFRQYAGAERIALERLEPTEEPTFDSLYQLSGLESQPLNKESVSRLFYDSLAISAWKQAPGGPPWALRVNPSSGNLHPTEGYLVSGPVAGLFSEPSICHYSPFDHTFEKRASLDVSEWEEIASQLPDGAVLAALTSIYWRESWKYGERAFRYCNHDVGHAIAAIGYAAAALGWETRLIDSVSHDELASLLGVDRQEGDEAEHPDCLMAIFPAEARERNTPLSLEISKDALRRLQDLDFSGKENRLSRRNHPWPVIEDAGKASRHDGKETGGFQTAGDPEAIPFADRGISARHIIRTRRSSQAMDGETGIDAEAFYRLLSRVTPSCSTFPSCILPWAPKAALMIFAHRVNGLAPGLYALPRNPDALDSLKNSLGKHFSWKKPDGCPKQLDLFLLLEGDYQSPSRMISCRQDIASDGALSLGMLAEFEMPLQESGASFYPRLFWETGLIGQILYLEAEAAGLRGTGIGCFFDDEMHDVLGISDRSWQSLYHFTVGGALEDSRIQTIPSYAHLNPQNGLGV